MKAMNYNLDLYIQSYFEFNDLVFPLLIDIKKIKFFQEEIYNYKVDIEDKYIKLDKTKNPFEDIYKKYEFKKNTIELLKYLDNRKMFDDKSFIEYTFGVDTTEKFFDILMKNGFSSTQLVKLKNQINFYISKLQFEFIDNVKILLDTDRNFPNYALKNEIPVDIAKFMQYSEGMTVFQSVMEYPAFVLFDENKGKAFNEFSWREVQFRAMYFSMKNKIEGFINTYQNWKLEQETGG